MDRNETCLKDLAQEVQDIEETLGPCSCNMCILEALAIACATGECPRVP